MELVNLNTPPGPRSLNPYSSPQQKRHYKEMSYQLYPGVRVFHNTGPPPYLPYCVSLFLYEHEVDIAISRSTYLSRDEDKRGLLIKWNGAVTKDFHIIPTISSYKLPTLRTYLKLRKASCEACEIRMEIKKEKKIIEHFWFNPYQFDLIVNDSENWVYLCLLSLSTFLIYFEATTML